jgi:hypothetical protein
MKASQILEIALNTRYSPDEYMCHCITEVCEDLKGNDAAGLFLVDKIEKILDTANTIVLCNYLKRTSKKYAAFEKRWGHDSKACYDMRVAFWQDMINELKVSGL